MKIGFTTGKPEEMPIQEKIEVYKELGCNALELSILKIKDDRLDIIKSLDGNILKDFDFISLHAPGGDFIYKDDDMTENLFEEMKSLYNKFKFSFAVIHPDRVGNWDLFKDIKFPIAIENMDHRKNFGNKIEELENIFKTIDVPMVLDVNHCYANDRSLNLVEKMYDTFGSRIQEIHLSGFAKLHDPLFETKQSEIIKSIPNKEIPIIIESPQPTVDHIKKEYQYITNHLRADAEGN